jgi:hemerythrin
MSGPFGNSEKDTSFFKSIKCAGFVMLLEWTDQFSVEIEELNEHHKYIVALINKLDEALIKKSDHQIALDIISELFDYASYHFGAEEALFEIKHYPFASDHIERHMEFRERLHEIRDLVEVGEESAGMGLREYLLTWWTSHILQCDKKYTPYLKS